MKLKYAYLALSVAALAGCPATAPTPGGTTKTTSDLPVTTTPAASDSVKPKTTYMYVMNGNSKTIDEINLKTMVVTSNVLTTGEYPNQLVTSGATTYMVNSGDHNIFKLDLKAHKNLGTINLAIGSNPVSISLLGNGKALVLETGMWSAPLSEVAFVDLSTLGTEATLSLKVNSSDNTGSSFFHAVANGKAYIPAEHYTTWPTTDVSRINVVDLSTRTVVKRIEVDASANPFDISIDPNGKVEVGVSTGILIIDPSTDTVTQTINFGTTVWSMQYVSSTKAYALTSSGMVSYNPTTGAILRDSSHAIAAGSINSSGIFKIFNNVAYVCNQASDSLTVIDLATETASGSPLSVGDGPQDLAFITVEDQ